MSFKTVKEESYSKVIINKSTFHGFVFPIASETEIKPIIQKLKDDYKGATHYCYAFSVTEINERNAVNKFENFNDDGEPSKTAGYPLLKIIQGNNLSNVLIVSVRFFGGIKLGTGGLVKAYTESGSSALKNNELVDGEVTIQVEKEVPISNYSKFEYFLKSNNLKYESNFSGSVVSLKIFVPLGDNSLYKSIEEF